MRKIVKILLVALSLFILPLAFNKEAKSTEVSAETPTVYVSSMGNDGNNGSENAPYQTLEKALTEAENGGMIILQNTVKIQSWNAHGKTVTITGGVLDASEWSKKKMNYSVTFTNVTVKASEIYANGNKLVIGENVTIVGDGVSVYGGGTEGSVLEKTDLTVLSGTYSYIFGGSYKGTVERDVRLTVGGTTTATNVFGGSNGSSVYSLIGGTAYVKILGGKFESVYGGNQDTNCENDVDLEITGGEMVQVFGGGHKAYLTGTVELRLLGGKITRRVYGGCYNETQGTKFQSNCYVNGKIYLTLGGVNIDFSSTESDQGIFARSRHKTEVETEQTVLTFANETAYQNYKDKLAAQDLGGRVLMGSLTAADEFHYYTYTQNGTSLTQNCAYCKDFTATMEMMLDESVSLWYTGEAIEPVIVTYSENWVGEKPQAVYENNTLAGQAACSVTIGQVCVELNFIILEAPTILGGSVRLSNPSGLRFQSIVSTGLKDSGATFGTLIIPKEVLGEQELTHGIALVEIVEQEQWATEIVKKYKPSEYREGYEYFNAVLTKIPEEYYGEELVARSYVCINGEYHYSEEITRSIAQVAAFALEDGYTDGLLYEYVDATLDGELKMESSLTLWEDENEYTLTLQGNPNGYAVIWSSSNEEIVSVDKNGKVKAGSLLGRAVITAKLGSQVVTCTVLVTRWSKYY